MNKTKIAKNIIVCGVVFFLVFLLNIFTPMHADDYSYSFSFMTGERLKTIVDVFYSQIIHYQQLNGRISTLGLAQILLMLKPLAIDSFLSFSFVTLGVLIAFHIDGSLKNINWLRLTYIYMALFFFTPAFGQSYLWINSAAIYLCGVIMILLYLMPYRKLLSDSENGKCLKKIDNIPFNIIMFIIMTILGFIAGNSQENMSVGLATMVIAYLIIFYYKKIKIKPWMLGIGNLVGLIALLFSPGNQKRLGAAGGIDFFYIPKRFILVSALFLEKMWYFFLALALLILVLVIKNKIEKNIFITVLKYLPIDFYIYFWGTLASVYSMIVLNFFPGKAWSSCVTFSLISIMILVKKIIPVINVSNNIRSFNIITITIIIIFGGVYLNAYFTVKSANAENNVRLELIENAVKNGEKSVKIPSLQYYNKWCVYEGSGELSWNSNDWPNASIARYYGLDEVIREDNPNNY